MIVFSTVFDLNRPSTKQIQILNAQSDDFYLKINVFKNNEPYDNAEITLKKNGVEQTADLAGRYSLQKLENDKNFVTYVATVDGIDQEINVKYIERGVSVVSAGVKSEGTSVEIGGITYNSIEMNGEYEDGTLFNYLILASDSINALDNSTQGEE